MTGQERPTASVRRVDVSPTSLSASAAPANPEDLLFKGYGNVGVGQRGMFKVTNKRVERCACGGTLYLTRGQSVEKVVDEHNGSARHRAWRVWREMD